MTSGRAALLSLLVAIALAILILTGPGIQLLALLGALIGFGLALVVILSIDRRVPLVLGAAAAFVLTFLVLMPIGCSGGEGDPTTCSNLLRVPMPGFSGRAAFTPSYWSPGIVAGLVAIAMYFWVRRRGSDQLGSDRA